MHFYAQIYNEFYDFFFTLLTIVSMKVKIFLMMDEYLQHALNDKTQNFHILCCLSLSNRFWHENETKTRD